MDQAAHLMDAVALGELRAESLPCCLQRSSPCVIARLLSIVCCDRHNCHNHYHRYDLAFVNCRTLREHQGWLERRQRGASPEVPRGGIPGDGGNDQIVRLCWGTID